MKGSDIMSKHTKGKLSLNNYHYPHAYLVIRKGSEDNDAFPRPRKICDVTLDGKTEEEYEANAEELVRRWNAFENDFNVRLVAAAPDLLEACKKALPFVVAHDIQQNVVSGAALELQAAIAKAKP